MEKLFQGYICLADDHQRIDANNKRLPTLNLPIKVDLNDNFTSVLQQEDGNLQEVIQFISVGNGKTKIISSMIGWGPGEQWEKTYRFFEKATNGRMLSL